MVRSARLKPRWNKLRYLWVKQAFEQAGIKGSFGKNVRFHGNIRLKLGDRVAIRDDCQFGGNGSISIGNRTTINAECILTAMKNIHIGNDVMIAPRVYILDVDHKFQNPSLSISKQGYNISEVTIGNDVWIGTGAVITKGVKIGNGSIVGANSVVTSNIPDYKIVAGNPACIIKSRIQ